MKTIAAFRRYFFTQIIFGLLLSMILNGCDSSSPTGPDTTALDLTQPWLTATPAEVGIDADGLSQAVSKAAAIPRFLSLLVVKDGRLVLEQYFHGNHAESLNDVRSVTKSVVSTLVGIALKEGFIGSLDETLGDYLHLKVAVLDSVEQSISIRHLLTMTAGFQWDELSSNSYSTWISSNGHIQHVFDQPIINPPGSQFTYNSGAVHLLGVLVERAVGMPLPEFADQYLFSKIGIERRKWEMLTDGYVTGGAGIDLRPRDLARLGQFYLMGGATGGSQILPANWTDEVTMPRFGWRFSYGALQNYTYGYLWWVHEGQQETAFLAWGYGGQYIYVVPDLSLVVVATTNWRGVSSEGGPQSLEQAGLDIIINDVLPAAR